MTFAVCPLVMTHRAIPAVLLVPLLVVAIVVSSSACGTMANFNEGSVWTSRPTHVGRPPTPYGGVEWDIEEAIKTDRPIESRMLGYAFLLVDLGLSAGLDTATLPIVFWINVRHAWERAIDDQSGPKRVNVTQIEAVHSDAKNSDESKVRMPD
jgi:hypothetical protein